MMAFAPIRLPGAVSGTWIGSSGFTVPTPRSYVGRVGKAIPTGGIVLPAAKNGTLPITYAATSVPAGLTFTASTRALTGNPTTSGANTITYTATDSATPALVVSQEVDFPVVAATSLITSNDFDNRGYGLDTKSIDMFAIVEGEVNIDTGSNAATDIWLRPPRGMRGILHTDSLNDLGIGVDNLLVSRIRSNLGGGQIQLNQNRLDVDDNPRPDATFSGYFNTDGAGLSMYLQTLASTLEMPDTDVTAGGGFCRWNLSNTDRSIVRTLNDDVRFIWAFATST